MILQSDYTEIVGTEGSFPSFKLTFTSNLYEKMTYLYRFCIYFVFVFLSSINSTKTIIKKKK